MATTGFPSGCPKFVVDLAVDGEDLVVATSLSFRQTCRKMIRAGKGQFESAKLTAEILEKEILDCRNRALGRSVHLKRAGSTITYNEDKPLSDCSYGTAVYQGLYNNEPCAVKRLYKSNNEEDHQRWQEEVDVNKKVRDNRHLISYYGSEVEEYFVFLAMELCETTLHHRCDVMDSTAAELGSWNDRKEICRHLCRGLSDLHSMYSIVHRDLKPHNILFKKETTRNGTSLVLKIADFGLARSIGFAESKHMTKAGGGAVGTEYWIPPEQLNSGAGLEKRIDFSYDVHPCGSLLYYILSGGNHLFDLGNQHKINSNISEGRHRRQILVATSNNARLSHAGETKEGSNNNCAGTKSEELEAMHLIRLMVCVDPKKRPKMKDVWKDPFFMTGTEKLEKIGALKANNYADLKGVYESYTGRACDWSKKLKDLIEFMREGGGGNYNNKKLSECARFIRNCREHLFDQGRTDEELRDFFKIKGQFERNNEKRDALLVEYLSERLPEVFLNCLVPSWRMSLD